MSRRIVSALGAIGVEPLIAILQIRKPMVGAFASKADDDDWEDYSLVDEAASALGLIGDRRAVEPLISALQPSKTKPALIDRGRLDIRYSAAMALGDIGWKPGNDETGALYWACLKEWKMCASIGAPAIPTLVSAVNNAELDMSNRRAAAHFLVGLYKSEVLSEEEKQEILSHRSTITEKHTDYTSRCEGHCDVGLNVDFPF